MASCEMRRVRDRAVNIFKARRSAPSVWSETWTPSKEDHKTEQVWHMRCLRCILGISWTDRITNSEELALTGHVKGRRGSTLVQASSFGSWLRLMFLCSIYVFIFCLCFVIWCT